MLQRLEQGCSGSGLTIAGLKVNSMGTAAFDSQPESARTSESFSIQINFHALQLQ
jgi:hypothetical protein